MLAGFLNIKRNQIYYIPSRENLSNIHFFPQKFQKNREKSVPVQIYQGKKESTQFFDLNSAEKIQDSTFSVVVGQKCSDKSEKNTSLIKGK